MTRPIGECRFTMHVLWCIHDLLAYGLIFGQVTKGYKGCPCVPNTSSHHAPKSRKMIYDFHCRWLLSNHPYQSNTHDFNGKTKRTPPPPWWLEFKSWSTLICMKPRRLLMAKKVLNEYFLWPTISKGLYFQVFSTFNGKFESHLTFVSWVLMTANQTSNLFLR